jgi:hypothetical protein
LNRFIPYLVTPGNLESYLWMNINQAAASLGLVKEGESYMEGYIEPNASPIGPNGENFMLYRVTPNSGVEPA